MPTTRQELMNAGKTVKMSASHKEHVQAIHDSAQAMHDHATDILSRTSQMMPDPAATSEAEQYPAESGEGAKTAEVMVAYGDAVKATQMDDGNVKLGGYLVRFTDEDHLDITGDFFTKDTDFGDAVNSHGYFNHRLPVTYQGKSATYKARLPDAQLHKDDVGIFAEIILGARNDYEKLIADMGLAGKLGWSSGTANHLTDYAPAKNGAREIKSWPLGLDASLTSTPAEPQNMVVSLKSLSVDNPANQTTPDEADAGNTAQSTGGAEQAAIKSQGASNMTDQLVLTPEQLQGYLDKAAAEGVKAYQKAQPAPDNAGVTVTLDEADRPFRSLAEMAKAVKTAEVSKGRQFDPRLLRIKSVEEAAMKSNGANESIPADGGYLVEPTISKELISPIHETGIFSSQVRRLPVSANSNYGYINGIDETSRATGSRWGGVRGYRLAEGDTKLASRPKFRRINWELKKFAALMYATDELIMDAAQFNAVANQSAGEEIAFMVNDDILNGLGVGGPQGALISGALISVIRADVNKIAHADVVNMWQRVLPRNKKNAQWYCNSDAIPQLQALYFAGSASVLSPYVRYGEDGELYLFGKKVNETEFNPATGVSGGATGDLLVADFSDYLFWDKGDVQAATSIHIAFLTDETAFRFVYRCDGQTAWASPITPYKAGATVLTQSAFVALKGTSN